MRRSLSKFPAPFHEKFDPLPTNFHLEQPTRARALDVLEQGVPGTAMPSWTGKLSDSDRQLLSGYIRSFFATPTIREQEQPHD
jgi:hypothetical protein